MKGVGPKRAEVLKSQGLHTAWDLVNHLPRRYLDRTQILKISELEETDDYITVIGRVGFMELLRGFKGRRRLLVGLDDGTDVLNLVWFEFQDYWKKKL